MTDEPFTISPLNFTNTLVNREAHSSLQLLHRRSSDEDCDDDDDDEEEEDEDVEEEENDEDEQEIVDDDGDDDDEEMGKIEDENLTHPSTSALPMNHSHPSKLSPQLTSLASCPFPANWGRGTRPMSVTPPSPTLTPVVCGHPIVHVQNVTNPSLSLQTNGNEQQITPPKNTVTTITTTRPTNGYPPRPYPNKRFDSTMDFSFNTSSTKIIFVNELGYRRALHHLDSNRIEHEPTRNYADIWSFGLNSRTTRFYHLAEQKAHHASTSTEWKPPQACIFPNRLSIRDSQFWFAFERRPIFNDVHLNTEVEPVNTDLPPITNNTILRRIRFCRQAHLQLSYGALTSMNEYYYHPEYVFPKQTEWTIMFRPKKMEIDRLVSKNDGNGNRGPKKFRRSTIPADLIDRTALFSVNSLGFRVYICLKGNVHEFTRTTHTGDQCSPTERVSSPNDDCPIFSTLCIEAFVKTRRSNGRNDYDKYAALSQVKELFRCLIDFFYNNQISVCFAEIQCQRGNLTNVGSLSSIFTSPVQSYAFSMLRNVGYCVEQKLSQQRSIGTSLLQYAKNDDDKFYRLCLYLFRRASEYRFLNLESELAQADREYQTQLEQCKALNETMATILSPPKPNFAYVPSIRITPTTVQIQPLKLVKLHRVIRERNFNDPMSFALVEIRDEANRALYARDFRSLRAKFHKILTKGIRINRSTYQYLHHSMSQVKEKQFWFLDNHYSLNDVLSWMGNFDNERVVAKHAARIAQCFTSTEPSIRITAECVKYIPDVETPDKQYCFTDGVGTISQTLCKQVQKAMNRRFMPSVLQIRYGGCKGTLSVDPNLDDQQRQLVIRESMRKFTSDHDQLEICKISSPRALYLNRQAILLLSSRGISESHFLVLQNENHLWLVQALLCSSVAFELLTDRVGSNYFNFRDIAGATNLVEEPFFLQLIITCGHDCVSKFQQRAKIRTAKNKARNMFGIVDEYGVLEYGQVFIQYSHISDEKLDSADKPPTASRTILDNVTVAITKNPCHHTGDLRTFTAVDRKELRHLVDVVVFPQKGHRPHPNEISGSDLDGDEYAVIWDPDLVPTTKNDDPYDYDSQDKPVKLDRPVKREDIIEVVLDIAVQNLTGDMSNLHLAMADLLGPRHPKVLELAGLISQELDAPKTGKHPISSEQLNRWRNELLQGRYPDFMMRERYKSYSSNQIIGQLYRSARRAIIRWHKAARTHCSLRHLHAAQLDDESSHEDGLHTIDGNTSHGFTYHNEVRYEPSLTLDPLIRHRSCESRTHWAKTLFSSYREGLQNIISVFNYQDEIDLFCRCEALDQVASGKQDLNISAGLELQRLIDTTRRHFYHSFDQLSADETSQPPHTGPCTRDRSCESCKEEKLARAAACYSVCYMKAAGQSTKARSRILSFPWLFSSLLMELKKENQKLTNSAPQSKYIVIGRAMRNISKRLLEENQLRLKVYIDIYVDEGRLFLRPVKSNAVKTIKRPIVENDQQTELVDLTKILFIEIMNYWIRKQNVFGDPSASVDKKPIVREICWHQLLRCFLSDDQSPSDLSAHFEEYQIVFQSNKHPSMTERYTNFIRRQISVVSPEFDSLMHGYCTTLIRACFQIARERHSNEYAYLSDYLILALQSIGIEKDFNDICFALDTQSNQTVA